MEMNTQAFKSVTISDDLADSPFNTTDGMVVLSMATQAMVEILDNEVDWPEEAVRAMVKAVWDSLQAKAGFTFPYSMDMGAAQELVRQ